GVVFVVCFFFFFDVAAVVVFFFFFQAEDGIRDATVTGVQTCALPISRAEAGGRFKSFWEFCEKVDLRLMNKRVIESLIKAGALDSLGTRGQLMAAVDKAMERAQKAQRDAEQGQSGLFGLFDETPALGRDADALPAAADWEESERLAY